MRPHDSQSSRENATPSSRTSPVASYKEVPLPPREHDISKKTMESKKARIKNLSDYDHTRDEINLLSRGLNYIPTPVTNESHIRKAFLKDFAAECAYSLSSTVEIKSRILFLQREVLKITFQKLNLVKDRRRYN